MNINSVPILFVSSGIKRPLIFTLRNEKWVRNHSSLNFDIYCCTGSTPLSILQFHFTNIFSNLCLNIQRNKNIFNCLAVCEIVFVIICITNELIKYVIYPLQFHLMQLNLIKPSLREKPYNDNLLLWVQSTLRFWFNYTVPSVNMS